MFLPYKNLLAKQALNSKQSVKGYDGIIREILRRSGYFSRKIHDDVNFFKIKNSHTAKYMYNIYTINNMRNRYMYFISQRKPKNYKDQRDNSRQFYIQIDFYRWLSKLDQPNKENDNSTKYTK